MADDGRAFLRCGGVLENRTLRRLDLPFRMIAAVAANGANVLIVPDQDPAFAKGRGVPYAYIYDERWSPIGKIDLANGQESDPPSVDTPSAAPPTMDGTSSPREACLRTTPSLRFPGHDHHRATRANDPPSNLDDFRIEHYNADEAPSCRRRSTGRDDRQRRRCAHLRPA